MQRSRIWWNLFETIRIILNKACFKIFDIMWDINICVTTGSFKIVETKQWPLRWRELEGRENLDEEKQWFRQDVSPSHIAVIYGMAPSKFCGASYLPQIWTPQSPNLVPQISSSGYTKTISICLTFVLMRHWSQHSLIRLIRSARRNVNAL